MSSLFQAISATATCYHHMLMLKRLQFIKMALVEVFRWASQRKIHSWSRLSAAVFTRTMVEC